MDEWWGLRGSVAGLLKNVQKLMALAGILVMVVCNNGGGSGSGVMWPCGGESVEVNKVIVVPLNSVVLALLVRGKVLRPKLLLHQRVAAFIF